MYPTFNYTNYCTPTLEANYYQKIIIKIQKNHEWQVLVIISTFGKYYENCGQYDTILFYSGPIYKTLTLHSFWVLLQLQKGTILH